MNFTEHAVEAVRLLWMVPHTIGGAGHHRRRGGRRRFLRKGTTARFNATCGS